jgi:hypothetical protein
MVIGVVRRIILKCNVGVKIRLGPCRCWDDIIKMEFRNWMAACGLVSSVSNKKQYRIFKGTFMHEVSRLMGYNRVVGDCKPTFQRKISSIFSLLKIRSSKKLWQSRRQVEGTVGYTWLPGLIFSHEDGSKIFLRNHLFTSIRLHGVISHNNCSEFLRSYITKYLCSAIQTKLRVP